MQLKKIGKWILIIIAIICGLVVLGLVGAISLGVMSKYGNTKYVQEQRSIPYMLGKGCDDRYNVSEEELKKEIESEIDCCVSKKKFMKFLLEQREYSFGDLARYNSKNSLTEKDVEGKIKEERCLILLDRIEQIINDLK